MESQWSWELEIANEAALVASEVFSSLFKSSLMFFLVTPPAHSCFTCLSMTALAPTFPLGLSGAVSTTDCLYVPLAQILRGGILLVIG